MKKIQTFSQNYEKTSQNCEKVLDNDKNYGIIKASRGKKDKENKKSSNFLHQND